MCRKAKGLFCIFISQDSSSHLALCAGLLAEPHLHERYALRRRELRASGWPQCECDCHPVPEHRLGTRKPGKACNLPKKVRATRGRTVHDSKTYNAARHDAGIPNAARYVADALRLSFRGKQSSSTRMGCCEKLSCPTLVRLRACT